jgi:hypothetical protein
MEPSRNRRVEIVRAQDVGIEELWDALPNPTAESMLCAAQFTQFNVEGIANPSCRVEMQSLVRSRRRRKHQRGSLVRVRLGEGGNHGRFFRYKSKLRVGNRTLRIDKFLADGSCGEAYKAGRAFATHHVASLSLRWVWQCATAAM